MVFRLMLALAVLAGMAIALIATTKSAHAQTTCPPGQVLDPSGICDIPNSGVSWWALAANPGSASRKDSVIAFAYNTNSESAAREAALYQCNTFSRSSVQCKVEAVNSRYPCAALIPIRVLDEDGTISYGWYISGDFHIDLVRSKVDNLVARSTLNVRQQGDRLEFCASFAETPITYAVGSWYSLLVEPTALTMTLAAPTLTLAVITKAPEQGNCANSGVIGTELDSEGTTCICPSGKTLLSDGNVNACVDPLPSAAANFLASDCISAGWLWGYTADPTGRFRQDCFVPSRIVNAPPPASSSGVNQPASVDALQVSANSNVDACVISRHAGFDTTAAGATDHPECNDQNLFASAGFPQKPSDISHSDILAKSKRITVQLAAGGAADATPNVVYNNTTLAHHSTPSGGGGGGGGGGAGIAIGVAAVVGLLALATWGGDSDSFTFSPDVGLNYDSQSGHILRYGSRVDFRENAWHAWWSAAQTNTRNGTGELRYGSGAEYAGEFWNARLQSDAYGDKSDSEFSLSAKKELGVWSFAPLYRVQYDKDETDENWRHSLLLSAVWRVEKWTLTNSAGFYGESLAAFGDNTSIKVLLRHDF